MELNSAGQSQGVDGRERLNSDGGFDRISSLPDSLIHHILSFLPSTKDSIKTSVLSKRWQFQWARVPTLVFDSHQMNPESFFKSIDRTLISYDCSKIVKFLIITRWWLPQFLFNYDLLVQLKTCSCHFSPKEEVNWRFLKDLHIDSATLPNGAIEKVISGSPLLESLELINVDGFHWVVIASKSLKRLVIGNNFGDGSVGSVLEISCPNIELLNFSHTLFISRFELMYLASSVCVTLDFVIDIGEEGDIMVIAEKLVEEILQPVQHVHELHIGQWFLSVLSVLEAVRGLSSPLMNCRCLTLEVHSFHRTLPGITFLLRNSPKLGELIIEGKKHYNGFKMPEQMLSSFKFGEDYWKSHKGVFNCLVSHLKIVDITRFNEYRNEYPIMVKFVKYILKNARELIEIVILQESREWFHLSFEICKQLLSAPRCSPCAVVTFI